jgi:hypothetical protein
MTLFSIMVDLERVQSNLERASYDDMTASGGERARAASVQQACTLVSSVWSEEFDVLALKERRLRACGKK